MRRREFVAGGATAALFSAMPSWAADLRRFKLGVITDEVTQDFEKALLWAKGYGLGWVELRFIWNKYVTDFAPDDIKRAKELLGKYDMKVSVVDTPYFKTLLPGTQSRFSEAKGDRLQSDFSQQAAVLERAFARAKDFATDKVRIFSFLRVADPHTVFDRVAKELEKTADAAHREAVAWSQLGSRKCVRCGRNSLSRWLRCPRRKAHLAHAPERCGPGPAGPGGEVDAHRWRKN